MTGQYMHANRKYNLNLKGIFCKKTEFNWNFRAVRCCLNYLVLWTRPTAPSQLDPTRLDTFKLNKPDRPESYFFEETTLNKTIISWRIYVSFSYPGIRAPDVWTWPWQTKQSVSNFEIKHFLAPLKWVRLHLYPLPQKYNHHEKGLIRHFL